jgi:hypothetical protein
MSAHAWRSGSTARRAIGAAAVALCAALPATAAAVDPPGVALPQPAPTPPAGPWFKPLPSDLIPAGLQVGASTLDLAAAPPLAATPAPQPFALADCDTGACTLSTAGTATVGTRRFSLARREVAVGAGSTRGLLVALPGRALAARRAGEALRLRITVGAIAGSGHRGLAVVRLTLR